MTVAELISELQRHDPHTPVLIDRRQVDSVVPYFSNRRYVLIRSERPKMDTKDWNQYFAKSA